MEDGFGGYEGGDEFGTPDVAGGAGDGEFVREAGGHVHDVGHESERGHLVGELLAEEEEVWVGRVGGLEVVESYGGWHPFSADGVVNLCAERGLMGSISGRSRIGAKFVHCEEDGVVFVLAVAAAVVFVDPLKRDVGSVVLD